MGTVNGHNQVAIPEHVRRVEARWHFTRPVSLRPGTHEITACQAAPVKPSAPALAPPEVAPEDRCQSPGCRTRWEEAVP